MQHFLNNLNGPHINQFKQLCPYVFVFPTDPVKCENPGSPEFGHRDGSNFLMGNEVVFGCENGYELVGSSRLHCLETGNWDNPVPYCRGEGFSDQVMPLQ